MKHKFIFLALTAMLLVLFGCNNNNTTNENHREDNIGLLSDTLKDHLYKQDSLSQELVQQIDTLTQELNVAKSEITKLQAADSKKAPSLPWDILPLLLGLFALIGVVVVGWCTRHDVESDSVRDIVNSHLRKIGISDLKERVQSLTNSRSQQGAKSYTGNDNIESLQGRIADLEGKIADLKRKSSYSQQVQKPTTPQVSPVVHEKVQPSATKRLYAKATNGKFFMDITETKQETCAFVIELMSDTKGVFDIASLGQITQMNGIENFIIYNGCRMEEATSYKTSRKGECEKQDNGLWKVTKELEITISK